MKDRIIIYGAYGHTGKFIVARLYEQGFTPILSGRDNKKLAGFAQQYPNSHAVGAVVDEPDSLDMAFAQADVIVNCAGPFLDTADPVLQSALRLGKHYIDLSAEQRAVLDIFEKFSVRAEQAEITAIPAAAFYGGLGDLLSTALTQDWDIVDEIGIYIGLDSWHPTKGTRLTGQRNHHQRLIFANGELIPHTTSVSLNWDFPKPIGEREMIAVPLTEIITISRHLNVKNIHTFISLNSIEDIRNTETPEPKPVDEKNRSSQQFCFQVVATVGGKQRTMMAQGRDIYAVTAPLVVEGIKRIVAGHMKTKGVTTLGQAFDAMDFLKSLSADDMIISPIQESASDTEVT